MGASKIGVNNVYRASWGNADKGEWMGFSVHDMRVCDDVRR